MTPSDVFKLDITAASLASDREARELESSLAQSGDKFRFPNAVGMKLAAQLCGALKPACERIIVAGSLRRHKPTVGDVEILYIGKTERQRNPSDLFEWITVNIADEAILALETCGVLERRTNVKGAQMFGPKNKLMRHRATGLPVDLFAATSANWWNYLVCRTGPAESNTRIAMAARDRGWQWNPYGVGFSKVRGEPEIHTVTSEENVFSFVGLPYAQPKDRR